MVPTLQRAAGNRAVARLLLRSPGPDAPKSAVLQRKPTLTTPAPLTRRWDDDEPYKGAATMHRTTRIEVSGWDEVGPAAAPRITYRRAVELVTDDRITIYLDVRGTVYLEPGADLPADPDLALATAGRLVRTSRTLRVEGGDVIPVSEYSPADSPSTAMILAAAMKLPDYAQLPLTTAQQETALLALLRTLPRKPAASPTTDSGPGAGTIAANVVTDFIPFIGELKDLYRAITGRDPVTGEKLAWWERALAFLGALPLIGKLMKVGSRIASIVRRLGGWLGDRAAGFGAWLANKFERWMQSRRARQLAKAQDKARRLQASEEEIRRLAEARRLARTAAPTLEEVKKLTPPGKTFQGWGIEIFGQGPDQAKALIGARSANELRALGLDRDVAQALYNWYRSLPGNVGLNTRQNRLTLLEHIIGIL